MNCRIRGIALFALLLLTQVFLVSCRSDYTASAVEKARTYAIENLHTITELQREYIRFTEPVIFENLIFPRYVIPLTAYGHLKSEKPEHFPTAPHQDQMHSCVVWAPPGLGAYVVVAGDGDRNMLFWTPNRVMIKKYFSADPGFVAAYTSCGTYCMNNMLYLSDAERNRVRFSEPDSVVYSKLDITPAYKDTSNDPAKSDWDRYLEELDAIDRKSYQMSLVWKADDPEKKIVFSGYSTNGALLSWKLQTAELMSTEKLNTHLLSKEEEAKIPKPPPLVPTLQYSQEAEIDRLGDEVAPDSPKTGGAVIYNP